MTATVKLEWTEVQDGLWVREGKYRLGRSKPKAWDYDGVTLREIAGRPKMHNVKALGFPDGPYVGQVTEADAYGIDDITGDLVVVPKGTCLTFATSTGHHHRIGSCVSAALYGGSRHISFAL